MKILCNIHPSFWDASTIPSHFELLTWQSAQDSVSNSASIHNAGPFASQQWTIDDGVSDAACVITHDLYQAPFFPSQRLSQALLSGFIHDDQKCKFYLEDMENVSKNPCVCHVEFLPDFISINRANMPV